MVAKVTLLGNTGKDPEIKAYGDKRAARFSIAVNRWVKKEKTTMWVNVVIWDQKKVDVVEAYVRKGTKLYIEGNLEIRDYEKDGQKKQATEVVIGPFNGELQLVGSTKDADTGGSSKKEQTVHDSDDDIPF
jgi:single-strand DNA-binding protein